MAAMITEKDIAGKSDAELMEIWREQINYRDEVVFWAGMELGRRGISIEGIQVTTVLDVVEREEAYHSRVSGAYVVLRWGGMGLVLLLGGLTAAWDTIRNNRSGAEGFSLVLVLAGIFCLEVARRKWRRRVGPNV